MRYFYFLFFKGNLSVLKNLYIRFSLLFLMLMGFSIEASYAQPGNQWEFSRNITLSANTPVADYQVKIQMEFAANHEYMKADGSDLRFYVGGIELDYWIERFNKNALSVIWVKVPAAGTGALTMYYGNPSATTTSNGFRTFDFFDDFNAATINTDKWAYRNGFVTKNASSVTINDGGYLSNKDPFIPVSPNTSFYLETKHKESAYHRIRYYTTTAQGTNDSYIMQPTNDYGYYAQGKGSVQGSVYHSYQNPIADGPFVQAGTNYVTQWQINDGNDYDNYTWNTINFDNNLPIFSKKYTVPDKLRYITIIANEDELSSTTVDWIRVRKSDGLNSTITSQTIFDKVSRFLPSLSITSVTPSSPAQGCEGSIITIIGTGFNSQFGLSSVKIGGTPVINPVSDSDGEIITATIGAGTTGKVTVTTVHGTANSSGDFIVYPKPILNVGPAMVALCQGGTTLSLGGIVSADANNATWSDNGAGGTFNGGATNLTATWTAPASFVGTVTFTLYAESTHGCGVTSVSKNMIINPIPTGSIDWGNLNICEGVVIAFTAPAGYDAYDFMINGVTWIKSGNNVGTLPSTAKTTDIVSVKVSNSLGCSVTHTAPTPLTITKISEGNTDLSISEITGQAYNDDMICLGDKVNFNFTNSTYSNYKFTRLQGGSLLQNGTQSYLTTNVLQDGDQVKLEVTNGVCTKEFLSKVITVKPLPIAGLSSDKSAECAGLPITFTATGGLNYAFLVNNHLPAIKSGTDAFFTTNSLQNGNTVSVIVTDFNKCSSTSTPAIPITIHPLPVKPIITPVGPLSFCEGAITPATLTSSSALSYQWYKNGTPIPLATGQSYTTLNTMAEGLGTYTVVVKNATGCFSPPSEGVIIVVNPLAAKPTVSNSSDLEFCLGGSVELTSSTASTYQWYFSTTESGTYNPIPGQTNQKITLINVTQTGYYSVRITNANGCAGAALSDPKHVIINALPVTPEITVTVGDLDLCDGETVTLSAPLSSSYQWFKGGNSILGETNRTYTTVNTLDAAGNYTVQVANAKGCFSTISSGTTVKVNPLPIPTIDNSSICAGLQNTYITEPGKNNYIWTVVDGTTISGGGNSNSIVVKWANTPSSKSLNVAYQDPGTKCISTSQAVFTNLPPVVPVIMGDQQVCVGSTIIYTTDTEGEGNDYAWTFSDGAKLDGGGGANNNTITIKWNGSGPQSVSVNYKKGGCNAPAPTVYPVTVTPVPIADFSYSATPYCSNGTFASPSMGAGASKGMFTATAGLIIDAGTGEVNLSASTTGEHTVTNTIVAAGGCAIVSKTAAITITKLPTATIKYAGTPFCTSDVLLQGVDFTGTSGSYLNGVFSAPTGLAIDAGTGAINSSTSTEGSYIVSYTIPLKDGCSVVVVQTASPVVITKLPTIALSYVSNVFCVNDNVAKSPSLNGSTGTFAGGNYTVLPSTGLTVNATNGTFTPFGSTAGSYTITYTTIASAGCAPVSKNFGVTITSVPKAAISYPGTPFCKTETAISVKFENTAGAYKGGVYSSTTGLSINTTTGVINPSTSTAGTYTVTYTMKASGGCAAVSVTTSVSITEAPTAFAGNVGLETCANGGPIEISTGSTANHYGSLLWTTSGDGTFSNPVSLTNNQYTPNDNDKANGTVTLTLTATGKDGCASVSHSKVLKINPLPAPVVIIPSNPEFCEGTIQPLTSVKNAVTSGIQIFTSEVNNVAIPDNNFTGIKNKIAVTGIPANAVINNISVKFNITHPSGKELIGNLRSSANKEINLFYMIGSGSNFSSTVISSTANSPIQTIGSSPFTGTFSPQGTMGAMGAAFSSSFTQLYTTAASLNGDWYLKLSDMVLMGGNTGILADWSITISYSIPVDPVPVIWSPLTDLYLDANAEIPYTGQPLATVYTKVSHSGTATYTATNLPAEGTGCKNSSIVDLIVKESPVVQIGTDYCSDPGRVILKATATGGAPFTFKWNTGISGDTAHIDEARDYYVSATNIEGCVGTAMIPIARELVINGDFEQGYLTGTFLTGYTYVAGPGNQTGSGSLRDEGKYAIDSNANKYHENFFGKDHTTPEQKGKFMFVNGTSDKVIWEQTIAVDTGTRYYYSAWAMNLNSEWPHAKLQFSVNGVKMGSVADLSTAPRPIKQDDINVNNWVRFYYGLADGTDQSWYSGSATTATIRIINLEPSAGGNDFGIDDISFATLSPFIRGPLANGADKQLEVCSGTPIKPIIYQMGSGVEDPSITGLPPGWVPTFDGLNYKITGTPVNNTNAEIRYDYTLTIKGCIVSDPPKVMEGTIIVFPNSTLEMTSVPETKDQSLCIGLPMTAITYATSGQISNISFEHLPPGINSIWNNGQVTLSGTPTASGEFNYEVITDGGSCRKDALGGLIKVSPKSKAGVLSSPTICIGGGGTVDLTTTGQIGNVSTWQISNDGVDFTDIANSANASSQSFNNVTQSTYYRVQVKNDFCPEYAPSNIGKVRISNLWEGGLDTAWSKFPNWSAGSLPTVTDCSNTVIIPQVPISKKDPTINGLAGGNAQVINLNILSGGHLTVVDGGNLQVQGFINNNGILDAKRGGVEYNGNTAQSIPSGIFLNNAIGDLKISNSNKGLSLNAPIDVYRSLTFGDGAQQLITKDSLTLKSTKEQTAWLGKVATNQTISGKATVERYINTGTTATGGHRKSWQLLATPTFGQSIRDSWQEGAVSDGKTPIKNPHPGYGTLLTTGYNNVPTNGFDLYTGPGPSIKTFNSATGDYDRGPVSTLDPIYNPNGYLVLVRGDRTVFTSNADANPTILRTKGTLLTGDQTVSVPAGSSWATIGNPYASAIEMAKIVKTGDLDEFFIMWDPLLSGSYGLGGYVYLSKSSTTPGSYEATPSQIKGYYKGQVKNIQIGQAFMVQTTGNVGGTVKFTEVAKESGSIMVMRPFGGSDKRAQLRTNLFGMNADGSSFITDGTFIQFGDEYSNEVDNFDARKLGNTSENMSIRKGNSNIVIERRQPLTDTDTIFFNISGMKIQKYRLDFIAQELQDEYLQGFIEDLYVGSRTPLNMEGNTSYDFAIENIAGSYASDRFRIVFKTALAPLPVTYIGIKANQVVEDIRVTWNVENETGVIGYDIEKSIDGVNFIKGSHVPANNGIEYTWLDKNAGPGYNYYRLDAIYQNGKTELSNVVKVLIQLEPSKITVYPNPITNGVVNVHLVNQSSGQYKIRLLNPVGQVMINKIVTHTQGNSIHPIPWDYKMARGMYQIEVTKPDGGVNLIKVVY